MSYTHNRGYSATESGFAVGVKGSEVSIFTGTSLSNVGYNIGTLSSTVSGSGRTLSATYPVVNSFCMDDATATLGNEVYIGTRNRIMLFKDQAGVSIFGTRGQIKLADGVDLGTGVFAANQGYIEMYGHSHVTSGGKVWAYDACIEIPSGKVFNIDASAYCAGLHAELTGAGTLSATGVLAGLYIDSSAATAVWPYGAYLSGCSQALYGVVSLSSQTTENIGGEISLTSDSTYESGNITYSGSRGSSTLKLTGVFSGANGGFHNIYSLVTTSGAQSAAGDGVVGIKSVVTNSAAYTNGVVYGGMFIAKHSHATNTMGASASLVGLEAWAYIADAGQAATVIGGNFAIHNESTGSAIGGSVHRVLQLVCDNASGANKATESTGMCIWNMAGTWDAAIRITGAFTAFANFDDATSCFVGFTNAAPSTVAGQVVIVMANGNPGYIPVYSTTGN